MEEKISDQENMDSVQCLKLISLMANAYKLLDKAPQHQIVEWIKYGTKNIRLLNKIMQTKAKTVEEKVRIQTTISQLKSLKERFLDKQQRGAGIGTRKRVRDRVRWNDLESVFQGRIRTGVVVNLRHKDLRSFLHDAKTVTVVRLKNALQREGNLKVNGVLACKFQVIKNGETVEETKFFNTRNQIILPTTNIKNWFDENITDQVLTKLEDFQERDSGWTLLEIDNSTVNINRYEPLRAGLSTYIQVPNDVQAKKAVVNVENKDEYCFLWAVTAALYPAQRHTNRTSFYPNFRSVLKYDDINFPIALKDIPKFEVMNNLSVNVYGMNSEKKTHEIVPYYLSKHKCNKPTIHLLLMESGVNIDKSNINNFHKSNDSESDDNVDFHSVYHFAWIKNLSRLLSSQVSHHDGKMFLCDRCLCHFYSDKTLEKHYQDCMLINKGIRMILPDENNNILKFKNYRFKEKVPFVVYADLECILETTTDGSQKHVPHSAAYYLHCILFTLRLRRFSLKI